MQASFLASLDISEQAAFKRYRLAPLCSRRDIAMLGLLHRVVLGTAPQPLESLFPQARGTLYDHRFGHGPCHTSSSQILSCLGIVFFSNGLCSDWWRSTTNCQATLYHARLSKPSKHLCSDFWRANLTWRAGAIVSSVRFNKEFMVYCF